MASDPELLARIQRVRAELAARGRGRERGDDDFERVTVPAVDADALRDELIAERASVVIEIGLGYGSSALAIHEALVLAGGDWVEHVIIDAFQDRFHDAGWHALGAAGVADSCTLLRERSLLALPRLLAEHLVADAAFVDGSHLFHNVFVDLAFLRQLVRPGGLIVLDDHHWPSVATAVRYFELNTGWRPEAMAGDTRLRAYRLPDPLVEPSFEDFRSFGPESGS
jgi:predicted O-methyltransferase YrrM